MSCCCDRILNLCAVPVCGTLEINQMAIVGSGETYDLALDFLQTTITLTQEQTDGENISFDVSALNENFEYTGKIYDAAGEVISITADEVDYDCIKFRTVLNILI